VRTLVSGCLFDDDDDDDATHARLAASAGLCGHSSAARAPLVGRARARKLVEERLSHVT